MNNLGIIMFAVVLLIYLSIDQTEKQNIMKELENYLNKQREYGTNN